MDIYWGDLNNQWEHYLVACLIFFVLLREDIKRDFLLTTDYIRAQRLSLCILSAKDRLVYKGRSKL